MPPLPDGAGVPAPGEKTVLPGSLVDQNLQSVLETRTAGAPDNATSVCTDLSPARLSATMTTRGTPVCAAVMRHWMEEQDLR
jgi:hypothetical protein